MTYPRRPNVLNVAGATPIGEETARRRPHASWTPAMSGRQRDKDQRPMNTSPTFRGRTAGTNGALALGGVLAAIGLAAVIAFGGRGDVKAGEPPVGSPPNTPVPTAPPPSPAVTPSPAPSDGGGDAMPIKVDLDTLTPHDVYVDIVDRSGALVDAVSGTPSGGASVEPYTILVENVDEATLRLTWVDRPGDNALALHIAPNGRGLDLLLVQPEHDLDGDSIVMDRVLVLEFAEPIAADDVVAIRQDGLDSPGE
jgi:hypothetical protein